MRSARAALLAFGVAVRAVPAPPWAQASPFPIPRELLQPISFAWSGSLEGAAHSLATQLGFTAWTTMASGLPIPRPPPSVDVSISVSATSAADIVAQMNQQAHGRAVVILDSEQRYIQVVYYG